MKIIAFDLDGTLLNSEKKVTDSVEQALLRTAAENIHIVPATGRTASGIPPEVHALPFVRYAVVSNGARVIDLKENRTIYEDCLPMEQALALVNYMKEYDLQQQIYIDGLAYANESDMDHIEHFVPNKEMRRYYRTNRNIVADISSYIAERKRPLEKINVLFTDMELRQQICEELNKNFPVTVTNSLVDNLEINSLTANKGAALLKLGEELGVSAEGIMAFGDGANDFEMIKQAGTGVAMGNAISKLKEVADFVTYSNDDNGIPHALETLLFYS